MQDLRSDRIKNPTKCSHGTLNTRWLREQDKTYGDHIVATLYRTLCRYVVGTKNPVPIYNARLSILHRRLGPGELGSRSRA